MKQFANDELDELPVASSKPAPTTETTTATPAAVTAAPVKDELDDSVARNINVHLKVYKMLIIYSYLKDPQSPSLNNRSY